MTIAENKETAGKVWPLLAIFGAARLVLDPLAFAGAYILTREVTAGAIGVAVSEGLLVWAADKVAGVK